MKQLKIEIPEGKEIDQENSDLSKGIIKFKDCVKEVKSYEDIIKSYPVFYEINSVGIDSYYNHLNKHIGYSGNESKTKEQLEHLLCLNKLINVANYLNDGWKPETYKKRYFITRGSNKGLIIKNEEYGILYGNVYFKTNEITMKAIDILGEETIKKALTLNF